MSHVLHGGGARRKAAVGALSAERRRPFPQSHASRWCTSQRTRAAQIGGQCVALVEAAVAPLSQWDGRPPGSSPPGSNPTSVVFFMMFTPWFVSGARFNCSPIRLKTNVEPWRSVTGGNGQNRSHVHYKRRVLAAGPRLNQDPIDADVRILDHVLRKFRHADQLHVIRRQAMMALGRGVYIGSPIERQHGHIVHAIGSRIVPKMNTPGQVVLDRLLEQAGTVAYDAARQPKTRANEDPTPISHECGSIRCGSIHECEFTPAELQHCRGTATLPRTYNIAPELQHCWHPVSVFLFLTLLARVAHGQTWIEIGCSNTRPACRRTSTPTDTPRCGILSRRRAPLMDTRPRSPTWARR